MAILKQIYRLLILLLLTGSLTSCYSTFEPELASTPVLCMNSELQPDEEIIVFLSRTWRWDEEDKYKIDVDVTDGEIRLIVNGEYRENLYPSEVGNGYDPDSFLYEKRKCYKALYRPKSGDRIRFEASSPQYGEAQAEVTIPFPVAIDRVVSKVQSLYAYGDQAGFPAVKERCEYLIDFDLAVYFTDPAVRGNYYDVKVGYTPYRREEDDNTYAYIYSYPDFNNEPLFTEHVSTLESAIADTWGYSIFSDRQINGKTYPLRLGFEGSNFYYCNPANQEWPKEYGVVVTLRHINEDYYKHVLSLWESNDAIVGSLSGIGLASPVYAYSNVSTGAGVVAAYAKSSVTVPIVDLIEAAEKNN